MNQLKDKREIQKILSIPFIWAPIIAIIIFDIFLEVYHRICFPLYGLPVVKRSKYIKIDRHKLKYINFIQKVNCVYCGYVNGFMNYASKIIGETEKYWCGIRHDKTDKNFIEPKHHSEFVLDYNNENQFREFLNS